MNANNNASQAVQVNPVECARNALNFLSRAAFTRNERQAFDQCEGLLAAIADGQLVLTQAAQKEAASVPTLTDSPPKKTRGRKANGHASSMVDAIDGGPQSPLL
jgi:hypothetical protein